MGVPVQLGRQGVEKVIELQLTSDELAALHASAAIIKENINLL
jgi:malate dehydrogenase